MANIIKEGKTKYWLDGEGNKVPEAVIKGTHHHTRDQLVCKMVSEAKQLQTIIRNKKRQWERELREYLDGVAKQEGLDEWVGGTTIFNFAMSESVSIKIAKKMIFDERLQLAKQKIDALIASRSDGSDPLIVSLVERAFKLDNKGEVDYKQMIGLRQIQCDDPLWLEAMDLIADSQKVQSTKTYYYCQEKDETGKMVTITLDFAAL